MIEYRDVGMHYNDDTQVLHHINFTINDGELFVLVGPSGTGKTTALKMLNGLVVPTDGNIYFDGKRIKEYDIQKLRLQMGYVLQNISLFPNLTIEENIGIQLEELKRPAADRKQIAADLLNTVGLPAEKYAQRMPAELSGGEQQRVGIIRAIAAQPKVVLMDEPFSALDPVSRHNLQDLVLQIHQKYNSTILFVTHDMNEALRLGDRIGVMAEGDMQQIATPQALLDEPANDIVRSFFSGISKTEKPVVELLKQAATCTVVDEATAKTLPQVNALISTADLVTTLREHPNGVVTLSSGSLIKITMNDLLDFLAAGGEALV